MKLSNTIVRGVVMSLCVGGTASAATILVNTDDGIQPDSFCSLGEAINNANSDNSIDHPECDSGSGSDVIDIIGIQQINIDSPANGLTAYPTIASPIVISGHGVTIARTGSDPYRLFKVSGSDALLSIRHAELRGGDVSTPDNAGQTPRSGGAFYVTNNAKLFIDRVTVTDNSADLGGGIRLENGSLLKSFDSVISQNTANRGAGLYAQASSADILSTTFLNNSAQSTVASGLGGAAFSLFSDISMAGSILKENSADIGGGMLNIFGDIDISQSLFEENVAGKQHGGYAGMAMGRQNIEDSGFIGNIAWRGAGGVSVQGGNFSARNVTVSRNHVFDPAATGTQAGGMSVSGNLTDVNLQNLTIVHNTSHATGGLYLGAGQQVVLNDSLISANERLNVTPSTTNAAELSTTTGNPYQHEGNVVGQMMVTTARAIAGPYITTPASRNITATTFGTNPTFRGNIFNSTLQFDNNPSPNMYPAPYHLLVPGSPAIDRRSCQATGVASDQRGSTRAGACDTGAIEAQ